MNAFEEGIKAALAYEQAVAEGKAKLGAELSGTCERYAEAAGLTSPHLQTEQYRQCVEMMLTEGIAPAIEAEFRVRE